MPPSDPPVEIDDRMALAIAVIVAGGLLQPLPGLAGTAIVIVLVIAARWIAGPDSPLGSAGRRLGRVEPLALALLLALLVRALAGLVIATPAMLVTVPVVLLAIGPGSRITSPLVRRALTIGLAGLVVGAGWLGLAIERGGPTPQGWVRSGPLLGVHPRQAIAVTLDGHGPHDVIADDHVEPDGSQGRDPASWAARLESELHEIAELHYAEGPARAREAFARARVELAEPIVPPGDRDHYGVFIGIEVRSGTIGEGSRVEFGCPGAVIDPRAEPSTSLVGECPRKYARDGTTGLGLSPRWPGYTELRGRDRLRLARLLGWPSGDETSDRRMLALELGVLALVLLGAMLMLARGSAPLRGGSELAIVGMLALFAVALLRPSGAIGPSEAGMLLPLAAVLAMAGRSTGATRLRPGTLVVVGLMIALGLSPVAGRAGAIALEAGLRELLVVDAGASWETAGVIAAAILLLSIAPGTLVCARALWVGPAGEGQKPARPARRAIFAVAIVLVLILRKPGGDPALLACGTALLLACWLPDELPTRRRWAAMALLALAAGFGLLEP